jgi:hypothetical protein
MFQSNAGLSVGVASAGRPRGGASREQLEPDRRPNSLVDAGLAMVKNGHAVVRESLEWTSQVVTAPDGRIAQGESTCLTSRGSVVRNHLRPPT